MPILAFANRTLLLLLLACAEGHHVALTTATPVICASAGFMAGRCLYILRQARVRGVVVAYDVALACEGQSVQSRSQRAKEDVAYHLGR